MFCLDALKGTMSASEWADFEKAVWDEMAAICERTERQRVLIGQSNAQNEYWASDDIGPLTQRIARADFLWEHAQGNRWDDPEFPDWWAKQPGHEYAKVKSRGTRIQSGFGGLTIVDRPRNRRTRIVYGKSA